MTLPVIKIAGVSLRHNEQMLVAKHVIQHLAKANREEMKDCMVRAAALGETYTAEQWASVLDAPEVPELDYQI